MRALSGLYVIDCDETEHLAERTGLEPATPGVTGRYSNQLNYRSKLNSARLSRGFGPTRVGTVQNSTE